MFIIVEIVVVSFRHEEEVYSMYVVVCGICGKLTCSCIISLHHVHSYHEHVHLSQVGEKVI